MADQTERLRIVIEADGTVALSNGLKLVGEELDKLGRELDGAGKGVKDLTDKATTGLGEWTQAAKTTTGQSDKLIDTTTGLTDATKVLVAPTKAVTTGLGEWTQATRTTTGEVGKLTEAVQQGDWRALAAQYAQVALALAPAAIGFLALAAAGAAVFKVMLEAGKETERQANALLLTGNYAGLVAGQLDALARSAATGVNANLGNTRQTVEALVAGGRVTTQSLTEMAQAIELVTRFSGKSRERVLGDFEGMANGVAKWAAEHNKAYHFLTLEQYQYIDGLEKAGNAQEAMRVTSQALSQHLGGDLTRNLGTLQKAWVGVKDWASLAWDAMLNVGRAETAQDRVAKLAAQLDALTTRKNTGRYTDDTRNKLIEDVRSQLDTAKESVRLERQAVDARSQAAQEAEAAIAKAREKERPARAVRVDPEIEARQRLLAELNGLSGSFAKDWERLSFLYKDGTLSLEGLIKAQADLLAKQPAMRAEAQAQEAIAKAQAAAAKELAKNREAAAAAATKDYEAHEREIDTLLRGNEALELQIAVVGKTKGEIQQLKALRLDHAIAIAQERLAVQDSFGFGEQEIAQTQRKIEALQRERDLTRELGQREDADEQRKKNEAESKKFSEDLRRDVTDGLMRGFEAGKDGGRNLADTVGNMFKTRILRAFAEALASPVLKPLEAALAQVTSGGGALARWLGGGGSAVQPGDFISLGLHGGGVVGAEATFSRSVSPAAFHGAPRFHGGGIAGDEQAIIAKRGEGVFTEGQMKALAPVGAGTPQITVNVMPTAGQTATVTQKQGPGGLSIDVVLRHIDEALADRVSNGEGALARSMEGRYGLRTAVA